MTIEILGSGQPDGTGVVKATTEKVHLYGGTAISQQVHIADGASSTGLSADSSASGKIAKLAEFNALVIVVNKIIADLEELGLNASA